MLYIPKTDDYSKILTEEEVKDFVYINFSEYVKSIRKEKNLKKAGKSLYIFLTTPLEVEKTNLCNQILLILVYLTIMFRF